MLLFITPQRSWLKKDASYQFNNSPSIPHFNQLKKDQTHRLLRKYLNPFKPWKCGKEPACRRHKKHGFNLWGQEDPLEEGMATHFSIPAWRIPWSEESDRLQSVGSQSQTLKWPSILVYTHTHTHTHTHISIYLYFFFTTLSLDSDKRPITTTESQKAKSLACT